MRRYLYFTVFASGMSVLAIELTASRLLGVAFGTSNLVWASIIGLILIYLTLGYFLGGKWADRSPYPKTMYTILAWGGFTSGLVPFFARPVLRFASAAFDQLLVGVLFGSFTAVLLLFIVPITLLGTISPFAIRLAITDPAHAGTISGRIYAISTLGSFIGTFLPVLILTPLVGTTWTFLIFSLLLILVAFGGLWLHAGWRGLRPLVWMPFVLLVAAFLFGRGPLKTTAGQIYETESAYNYIQVIERSGYRYLRLNEGQGIHSIYHPEVLDYNGPWEQFLAAPFFNPAPINPEDIQRIAVVGLAAGTTARQATAVFGPVQIDGFEIDPDVIQVGKRYFEMDLLNLNALAVDGRVGLDRSQHRYDVIIVDAYRPPYIPWHLATREFFEIAHQRMSDNGVLVLNAGRGPGDRRMIDALAATLSSVFPSIYVMDVQGSFNSILYATRQPSEIGDLYANLEHLVSRGNVHPLLLDSIYRAIVYLQPTPQGGLVFTDERAPVEWITNSMVLDFVLAGDIEEIEVFE
jgi:spermidine synthase